MKPINGVVVTILRVQFSRNLDWEFVVYKIFLLRPGKCRHKRLLANKPKTH